MGALFALAVQIVVCQAVSTIQPSRVIDLKKVVERDLAIPLAVQPIGVTEAAGHWAVLTQSLGDQTILITGDLQSEKAMTINGRFDRVRLDQSGRMHLRYIQSRPQAQTSTHVLVVDAQGMPVDDVTIPVAFAEPLVTDGQVKWKTKAGALDAHAIAAAGDRGSLVHDPNEDVPDQRAFALGLPGGRYLTFGDISEQITLFSPDGAIIGSSKVQFESAFNLAGVRFKPHAAGSGVVRAIWATTSPDGLLYVSLSDIPFSGPAYIAIFDPASGKVVNVLRALLPQAEGRRDAAFNPNGNVLPTLGAVGDRLVMVDKEMAVAVVY